MASRIHDLRVRQNQLDEWHVQPVVRELVHEERPVRAPLNRCPLEILLADLAALRLAELQRGAGVATDFMRQRGNVR